MELLFRGQGGSADADPYEALSDLCTMLVVADAGFVPLEAIADTLMRSLTKRQQDGDVQVMAARALALLLDKFPLSFDTAPGRKAPNRVTECVRAILALVADTGDYKARKFEKTTRAELTEELLRCLSLGTSSTRAVRAVMPETEAQLRFCESSLDGSKWTSCQVLRHCALLARGGYLRTPAQRGVVGRLVHRHLHTLVDLDMDYEWDELLRAVTEGLLTMRAWCGSATTEDRSAAAERVGRAGVGRRKSSRAAATPAHPEEGYAALCLRVCGDPGTSEPRRELVLACTNAVLHARDVNVTVSLSTRQAFVELLLVLLRGTSHATLRLGDPFARKDAVATEAHEEDGFRPLQNLQWEVPPVQWTALMLLAKLLGAEPQTRRDYVWAWRGEGDLWYWYRPRDRAALTAAFFASTPTVTLHRHQDRVDLLAMTHRQGRTGTVTRVHVQPVPFTHHYEGGLLEATPGAATLTAAYAAPVMTAARAVLRLLSFGSTQAARLARAVQLHVVCMGTPDAGEAATTVLRSVAAEQPPAVVEKLAARLVEKNRLWAPVLCDAGVIDLMAAAAEAARGDDGTTDAPAAAMKRQRREGSGPAGSRTASGGGPVRLAAGESPVVRMLRDVAASHSTSNASTPALAPLSAVQLPSSTAEGALERLRAASFTETVSVLEALLRTPHPAATMAMVDSANARAGAAEVDEWLSADSTAATRVAAALTAVLLRELQEVGITGRRRDLVSVLSQEPLMSVVICNPASAAASEASTGGAAEELCCPAGHPLRIHFSTNWRCDKCGQHTSYGSSACRACNYDLCYECVGSLSRRLEVSPTACVGDVARVWTLKFVSPEAARATLRGAPATGQGPSPPAQTSQTRSEHFLFTHDYVFPACAPARELLRPLTVIHGGPAHASCVCGAATCAGGFIRECGEGDGGCPLLHPLLAALLRTCAAAVSADAGVLRALVEAVEAHGCDVFLAGPSGLPPVVRGVLAALGPALPLPLRVDIAKFLTIDCRRYALYHLQERGVTTRGAVQGDINSNGLVSRVPVVRADVAEVTARLHWAFSMFPSLRNKVEFAFEGEAGTGNGPTQELYSELCSGYRGLPRMWHRADGGDGEGEDEGVGPVGFPSCRAIYWQHFFVLGAALARAFMDGYAMDVPLLPCVWRLLREPAVTASAPALRRQVLHELDPVLARSLGQLLTSSDEELAAMGLVDAEDKPLTRSTVSAYVDRTTMTYLDVGLENVRALGLGLATGIDLSAFALLTDEEVSTVLCGARGGDGGGGDDAPLFTEAELRAVTVAAHGYSADSPEVDAFIRIVGGEFGRAQQGLFLEFLTGTSRLPLSGLAGLGRKITVVKKEMDPGDRQQTLPSCSTCFLYFKLPPYTRPEIMRDRLVLAITEGRRNFALS